VQIFWKGDPNVENFIIKFKNEDTLRRWEADIEAHKEAEVARAQRNKNISTTQFTSMDGVQIENPHQDFDADDDDYTPLATSRPPTYASGTTEPPGYSEFTMSRNSSSTNPRSRSATGGSTGSATTITPIGRPPQRFPMPDTGPLPPLNTQTMRETPSPGERIANSYFSPVEDGTPPQPSSTRSSSQSTFAGYTRYGASAHSRSNGEEPNRNTAPAMSRNMTVSAMGGNPYLANGRGHNMRPPLAPNASAPSAQQLGMTINRMRSASSPDIHPNGPQNRRYANGQGISNGDSVPTVPPIPPHVAKQMATINRSQNNSPVNAMPIRNGPAVPTGQQPYGLPAGPRPSLSNNLYTYDPSYKGQMDPRQYTSGPTQLAISTAAGTLSPPLSTPSSDGEAFMPSQLKAKVRFDDNYISIVIASNIQFQSLIDRIDAKLARFTNHSIRSGSVRLKYQDEEEDFIWIDSDEAIHDALLDWRETHMEKIATGQLAEILLYAQSVNGEPIAGNNQS
jgi:cell division control protein 24